MHKDIFLRTKEGGTMIRVSAPCGKHKVFFPLKLQRLAVSGEKKFLFHTTCECFKGYVLLVTNQAVQLVVEGSFREVIEVYESCTWTEEEIQDVNGVFSFKQTSDIDSVRVLLNEHFRVGGKIYEN